MTLVLSSMGNLCLHTVPVYEARTVAELAFRVVEKQGKETKVGDLEKLLGTSCASKNSSSCRFLDFADYVIFRRVLAVVANDRQGESSPLPVPRSHRLVAEG